MKEPGAFGEAFAWIVSKRQTLDVAKMGFATDRHSLRRQTKVANPFLRQSPSVLHALRRIRVSGKPARNGFAIAGLGHPAEHFEEVADLARIPSRSSRI